MRERRERFAQRGASIPGSVIDSSISLLQRQKHDVVRFGMGSPSPAEIPTALLADALAEVTGRDGSDLFDYGPTEGEARLRDALPAFLERQGCPAPEGDRFLITSGGMQGLDLACKLLVDKDDLVVVESPTYPNGLATLLSYEARILEASTDTEGLRVGELSELVGRSGATPSVIYTIPTFQNPGGTTLSLARRAQLIGLADQWDATIIEDDPYGLLRFADDPLPSLAELAPPSVRVVSVNTFSKILAPGLRVGWVVADATMIQKMIDAKQGMDTCTNVPLQRVVAALLESGQLDSHLTEIRPVYARRKAVMCEALGDAFRGEGARWSDPDGGFFLWLEFDGEMDTTALFEVALSRGVAFVPGSAFSLDADLSQAMRLCFASAPEQRIQTGIDRLAGASREMREA
jgi:2-aminoadipate transaminase